MSNSPAKKQMNPVLPSQLGRHKRIWRATLMHSLEFVALILALIMAICGGLAWRLAQGPVSLEFLRKDAEAALVRVFQGEEAKIGTLQAGWSPQEQTIVIAASNVRVLDATGRVLVQVPQFDVGFSGLDLLQRKAVIKRIIAVGGEFSFVRKRDGRVGAGLGQPDQIALNASSVPVAGQNTSLASLPEVLGRLSVLAVRDATVHFVDERAGVDWVAPHANVRFARRGDLLTAFAEGSIESPSGTTLIAINASSHSDFSSMNAELKLTNAVPASLIPLTGGAWKWLGGIDAPLDAQITFSTSNEGLLRTANGHLKLAEGVYRKDGLETPIDSAEIVFSFDPIDGAVSIELAELSSKTLSGSLQGRIAGLDPARLALGEQVGFDIAINNIRFSPDRVFSEPLQINRLWLDGYYIPTKKEIEFKHLNVNLFDLSLNGSGIFNFPEDGLDGEAPLFSLTARSEGQITPVQLLKLWPVDFAFGGRDWVRRNVLAGRMHGLVLDIQLPQRALHAPHLDNDMLTLSFAFDEAVSHFVHTMTPLRDGEGTGVLRGNRFDLTMDRAVLKGMEISKGFVEIPRLSPKGVTGQFGGHATGPLGDIVNLLDEEPLGFVSKYGLSPDTITGQGEIDFIISRPMRIDVPARNVGFSTSGAFENIRVAGLIAGQDLAQTSAKFAADQGGMVVEGEGKLGSIPGQFTWQERFFPKDEPRTRLEIDVITDAEIFDDLGIPTRLFLDGPMGIHLRTTGEGRTITTAALKADLTQARFMSPGGNWEKPAGQVGGAELQVQRGEDGGYEITDFEASTEGFLLKGDLSIAEKGGVQSISISQARMSGLFDFTAELQRDEDGAFVLSGHAGELDARGFVRGLTQGASSNIGIKLDANITFDRALVSDEMTLKDGIIKFKRGLQDIESLTFNAMTPNGEAKFSISPDEDGQRQLTGRTDDAGLVIEALFGANSIKDGVLIIDGVLGDGKEQHTKLDFTMNNFKLTNVPVMARMLSLGSLTGIANTMSGEGIGFKKLVAPLEFDDGRLKIGAARATGPALGVTVTGTVNLVEKTMVLNGALAPAYSINSALGNIPIVGKALVSRKGEGVFGLSYKVEGSFDALQVFVNPLSALTPGVFRRIFEGGKTNVAPSPKKTEPPAELAPKPQDQSDGG